MAEARYLPENVGSKKDAGGNETVRIVSPPPPPVDIDRENRIIAVKAAAHAVSGAQWPQLSTIRSFMQEFEKYLKDGK